MSLERLGQEGWSQRPSIGLTLNTSIDFAFSPRLNKLLATLRNTGVLCI